MRLQSLTLDKFTRVNDRTKSDLLKPEELQVFKDMVLDYKLFKPIKRGKWTRFDAGTSTGGYDIDHLDDFILQGKHYLLAACDIGATSSILLYDIALNSWANWLASLTEGARFRAETYRNTIIFVFDTDDDPRVTDIDDTDVFNLDLGVADVSAIQSFNNNGGSLTQNTQYKWIIVGITEDGQLGPPSQPFTHFYHTARRLSTDNDTLSTKIYFKNLPHIADSRIIGRLLFRTKGDNNIISTTDKTGEVYYLAARFDNDSTGSEYQVEFEDDIADDDLGTDIVIYTNMPTQAKHLALNKDRLFLANFSLYKRNFFCPPSSNVGYDSTHDGLSNVALLTDTTQSWTVNEHIGKTILNITDGSSGTITANTATTITAALAGGTDNDWDTGDVYVIVPLGYSADAYELTIEDSATGGALNASEQYDYYVHYVDKKGRLSRYYQSIGTTTSGGGNTHRLTIKGIGVVDELLARELGVKVYRRTGGTGSYYLIFSSGLNELTWDYSGYYSPHFGWFEDLGYPNLTETWVDPDAAANVEDHPCRVIWSDLESPSTIREENFFDMYPEDGDVITGIFDDVDGIIIFKEKSICKIFTPSGSPLNWNRVKLIEEFGCSESWTLQKSGRYYYFVYIKDGTYNKVYRYTQGMERPEDIGKLVQDMLDTMTNFYDSAINDEWYVLQCNNGTDYYTLVYDIKINTWYKWLRDDAESSVDFKTLHFIKYGDDAGKLISNADDYVSVYNQPTDATRQDSEIGSNQDIEPSIKTKDFKFPDGISLARLRRLKLDYKKVSSKNTVITITDADTGTTKILTDSSSSGKKLYEADIGVSADGLKKTRSFNVQIAGAGLEEFDALRIDYRQIRQGKQVGR